MDSVSPSTLRRACIFVLCAAVALLALPQAAGAVTPGDGPGGVGTTDGASALELWVKADTLALPNGAAVATWSDASGNGRALMQSNGAVQPAFVTGAAGGQPVVRFTADYFASQSLPSTGNEFTLVAVLKPTNTGGYRNIIDDENSSRPMLWIDTVGNYEFNLNSGAVSPPSGGYDVVVAVKRNAGPPFSQLYVNGPNLSASGAADFVVAPSEVYDFFNRDGTLAFTGDVAELIIYSNALTPAEITKVGYYLQQKYSTASNFEPPFPVLSGYDVNPAIYGINSPIAPNSPRVAGGLPTGFSIAPALPTGLVLDPATGVISGTPTAVAAEVNYIVTATFAGHPNSSTQLSLEVTPPTLIGYSRTPAIFTRGRIGTPVYPLVRGGPLAGFSVSPALPPGLILDVQTGEISGIATAATARANYSVTAHFTGHVPSSYALAIEVLEPSATLDITEFMAGNDSTIADGHGEFSDWVEIHNYGTTPIDLGGWSLTDNASNLRKWIFPPRLLEPGAYLLVFASGDSHIDPAGHLHTDFRLEASGEYLGLVQPDGATIARQFAPAFPAQVDDVSYGSPDRLNYGAFPTPTPGAANGFFTAAQTPVAATPRGRAFSGTMGVTLAAAPAPGSVIRYTTDGTEPTGTSAVYGAALALSANTRVRARVFQPGLDPGPETSEIYLRLGNDLQAFSSNLPVILLHADGAIAPSSSLTLTGTSALVVATDPGTGRASLASVPNYAGRSGLRIRGRSSQSFPQKQFKFETWDSAGRDMSAQLLGLAPESDWVLNAPYTDKALVRNAFAYRTWERLGWPSIGTRFVEVFINDDRDGQFTYADDYAGIYMLVEAITLDRLGLDAPQNTTSSANITGGFVIETGNADDQEFSTNGSGRAVAHRHRDPGFEDLNTTQRTWIRDYVTNFERALYGSGFRHPTTGLHYSAYTDVASQVDYKIAREWSRNFDGGSTYSYVPRGGQLTMGPLWDYNWGFGNVNYAEGGDLPGYRTDGWNRSFTSATNGWPPWWLRFEQDSDWWQQFIDRWTELRGSLLSDATVAAEINALTAPLAQEAAGRHFTRWPQLGQFTVVSPPGWQTRTTYQSEVDYFQNWIRDRSAWIDAQFPPRPVFSPPPGAVTSGSTITLTAAAGQSIVYTTDGTDPRLAGGAANPAALTIPSGGSVTANASVLLRARARNGATWGAPAVGGFVTGLAANAANIVVSEIAYHPAAPSAAELANDPTLSDDDFEFIELRNIGGSAIDLTGASFTEGVRFTFGSGSSLAAGGHLVIVENAVAFALRYGANVPVAGQYTGNLDNDGDTVVLRAASNAELVRFTYRDAWSFAADGRGYALTLRDPTRVPSSYDVAAAWGLSGVSGGSPAADNGAVFASDFDLWRQSLFPAADAANPQRSGLFADPDVDGAPNLLEFALVTDPLDPASRPAPILTVVGSDLVLTFTRLRVALNLAWTVEQSLDGSAWIPASVPAIISQTNNTESLRAIVPQNGAARKFLRVRVTQGSP